MSRVINIIGNNAGNNAVTDGGRIKLRLFEQLLIKDENTVKIIDLFNWKFRFFKIISQIKKAIKNCEDIVIMAGPNGCRFIIPIVYKLNRKKKSRVIFCPVGIGTLDKIVRKIEPENLSSFLLDCNFSNKSDKRFEKYLSSFKYVVVENNVLKKCYEKFYKIKNVQVLQNFRVFEEHVLPKDITNEEKVLNCIFLSRVNETKGIQDLVEVLNEINNEKVFIHLDIFGDLQMTDNQKFISSLGKGIEYKGLIEQKDSYKILSQYDLFILPTKYHGEGTPGALVESLISGVPVLVSNYSQSNELVVENYNGYKFDIGSKKSLKEKLQFILSNKASLQKMRKNVIESSKQFIFEYIKDDFYKYIGGKE